MSEQSNESGTKSSNESDSTIDSEAAVKQVTEETRVEQHLEQPAANAAPAPASSGKGLGILALLISLIALAGAGYAWYQTAVDARIAGGEQSSRLNMIEQQFGSLQGSQSGVDEQINQIRQRVADTETGVSEQVSQVKQLVSSTESALVNQISEVKQQIIKSEGAVGAQIREIRTDVDSQQQNITTQLEASQAGLKEQSSTFRTEFDNLSGSIQSLKAELGSSVDQWSLREVEHLLVLANQRLQLAHDAPMARQALKIAETNLQSLNNPALLPTRKALSEEIAALDGIKSADLGSVTNTLSLLSSTLENLPLLGASQVNAPTKATSGDSEQGQNAGESDTGSAVDKIAGFGKSFLTDLGGLIQVEEGGKPIAPSISPEIARLTVLRGRMMLESAQVALVRQQNEVFLDRINAAEAWVGEKFDTSNDQTSGWLEELGTLKSVEAKTEFPDISASLSALRKVIGAEG